MKLNEAQRKYLLSNLKRSRVSSRTIGGGKTASYVEAYDIRRTLNVVFGFGNWDLRTLEVAQVVDQFEERTRNDKAKTKYTVYTVGYRATVELTIHDTMPLLRLETMPQVPGPPTVYSASAVGVSENQPSLAQAHDHSLKTAESDALKRAAHNLGTQFGLSLYQGGTTEDIVKLTLDVDPFPESGVQTEQVIPEDEDQTPVSDESDPPAEAAHPAADRPNVGTVEEPDDKRAEQVMEQLRAIYRGTSTKADRLTAIGKLKSSVPTDVMATEVADKDGVKRTVAAMFDLAGKDAK